MQMQTQTQKQREEHMSQNLFKRTGSDDFPAYLKCLVTGPPKSGKTSLLGTVPNLIVLDTEPHANNLQSIAHLDVPYVTITNTDDLLQVLMMLRDPHLRKSVADAYGMPDIEGVAIDTLDTLQRIMKQERQKSEKRGTDFLRDDWGWLKTEMEKIVEAFTALPMHVFFMVHSKTKELGKGDDAYTVTLPGLQGGIDEVIAGMVGYSLMSFRKEEVQPDGTLMTKYYLRTEGDSTHEFLGTRVGGVKLPTVIEPQMATIYNAVMAARPKKQATAVPAPAAPVVQATGDTSPVVSTATGEPVVHQQEVPPAPAETPPAPTEVPAPQESAQNPGQPAAPEARPADDEPLNAAALGHLKRVYDAVGFDLPEEALKASMTLGEARKVVVSWRGLQEDEAKGNLPEGSTAVSEMQTYLGSLSLVQEKTPEPVKEVEPKVDGTIEQVEAYVAGDMARAQEAFDLEIMKGEGARKGLVAKLEALGARPQAQLASVPDPAPEVETPVETSAPVEAAPEVTPELAPADSSTEAERDDKALEAATEGLGATVIDDQINPNGKCEVCNGPLDDIDLAELGKKRYGKLLCVTDYLAEQRK